MTLCFCQLPKAINQVLVLLFALSSGLSFSDAIQTQFELIDSGGIYDKCFPLSVKN